ncbi:MAG: hypothetical protein IKY29_02820 [Clostridia bacterium]|nr:hypothetical protein [Clostridia bacterium]
MKRLLTNILLLLLALSLCMGLVACGPKGDPTVNPDDENEQPEDENEQPEETPAEPFVLSEKIVIVRGEDADANGKKAAAQLKQGILDKTGVELEISTDYYHQPSADEDGFEILVGKTDREMSDNSGLSVGDFYIRLVDGKKLVIIGRDSVDTEKAVGYFLENCMDENGFTFKEIDMKYDATEEIDSRVTDEMRGTLSIDFDNVINPEIIGGGVNFDFSSYVFINLVNGGEWAGVRSQHIPYTKDQSKIDQYWKEYFDMIDYSGMQYVRLCVSMTMWEPINDNDDPMTTDFERGFVFSPKFSERPDAQGEGVGFPALNYAYLESFYRLLDHFEERGLYVVLGNWDNGSEALGFCPGNANWLASTDANGNKLGRGDDLNVVSVDEYAETFAAIMYHLKVEKGYDCVKGISFYNEPEHLKGGQKTLVEVYTKMAEHMTRLGVRDDVLIQAYDGSVFWMAADNGNNNRVADMVKQCGNAMDIIGYHCYLATLESGQRNEGVDIRGTVSTYMIPLVEQMIKQAGDRPVIVSELGTFAFNNSAENESSPKDFRTRLFAAEAAIELFNCGAKGYGLWTYNCYLHNYYTMLEYDSADRYRLIPDDVNYYPSALIMKYLPGGTDIVASEIEGCADEKYQHVWATVGIRPDTASTILLVNDGDEPAQITLKGAEGAKYRYYFVDAEHTDNIYEDGEVTDYVVLRPNSIVVLIEE